jgi:hypothetical protein
MQGLLFSLVILVEKTIVHIPMFNDVRSAPKNALKVSIKVAVEERRQRMTSKDVVIGCVDPLKNDVIAQPVAGSTIRFHHSSSPSCLQQTTWVQYMLSNINDYNYHYRNIPGVKEIYSEKIFSRTIIVVKIFPKDYYSSTNIIKDYHNSTNPLRRYTRGQYSSGILPPASS